MVAEEERLALKGLFVQGGQSAFEVDADVSTLTLCVTWLYTGTLHTCDCFELVCLYVLADKVEILALRRAIMTSLHRICQKCLVPIRAVRLAWRHLDIDKSPLIEWLIQHYIHHEKRPGIINIREEEELAPGMLDYFFRVVARGQDRLLRHNPSLRCAGWAPDPRKWCHCCSVLCVYQEFEDRDDHNASECYIATLACTLGSRTNSDQRAGCANALQRLPIASREFTLNTPRYPIMMSPCLNGLRTPLPYNVPDHGHSLTLVWYSKYGLRRQRAFHQEGRHRLIPSSAIYH